VRGAELKPPHGTDELVCRSPSDQLREPDEAAVDHRSGFGRNGRRGRVAGPALTIAHAHGDLRALPGSRAGPDLLLDVA
jgi:hypothetical protein